MTDQRIGIPNWDTYQHYKDRDPVWLRDYIRQLWNRQWTELTLPQRGLLWTARLGYAHHNGDLWISDLTKYVTKSEHRHVPAIAKRVNQAGLLGFVSSASLSLSLKQVHAREQNGRIACPFCEVGAGLHAADCPTLDNPETLVTHLLEGGTNA